MSGLVVVLDEWVRGDSVMTRLLPGELVIPARVLMASPPGQPGGD